MTAEWVRMEGNEDDVVELRWNKLEASIGSAPTNWFAVDQHAVFDDDMGLPKGGPIIKIDRIEGCGVDLGGIENEVPYCTQFGVVRVCLYPAFARG